MILPWFLLLVLIFLCIRTTPRIPRVIFTYWSSADARSNDLARECISTWRTCNPDWTIHALDDNTLWRFTELRRGDESVQHFADRLRLDLLERYGGVWLDATIWMNTSLNWIHSYSESVIGFKNPIRPENEVMENWFIACVPGSQFIREWKREFAKFDTHDHLHCVSSDILKRVENPKYLLQNVAWAVVYHRNPELRKDVLTMDSKHTAFAMQWKCDWDPERFAEEFKHNRHQYKPFVKITQVERQKLVTDSP